ncbi:class I SAM-dependent methyltransferase [bacterium]|nr:class I SAM-dependent methyltransferase [bacterium]
MILVDIVNRKTLPLSWGEGEYIPHDDPCFSRKMLEKYLNEKHESAGRRFENIDRQMDWIHHSILNGQRTKILEIGCGPGFYTRRLAQLGHECVGIDVSPAAITYAQEQAQQDNTQCTYIEHDIYSAQYGTGYGLIIIANGDFNMFSPMDAYEFLGKAWMALREGGILLLEPYTFEAIESLGKRESVWEAVSEGLYSDKPYLCLHECCWNGENDSLTKRWYIVDTETAHVRYLAQCYKAYTKKSLQKLLVKQDFFNVRFYPGLRGGQDMSDNGFMVVSAVKTCKYTDRHIRKGQSRE